MECQGVLSTKVRCVNLPNLVTKIITSFLDVNVEFEASLEIAGSLHIYSDGEKVAAFMVDEVVSKAEQPVQQQRQMPPNLQNFMPSPQAINKRQQTPRKRAQPMQASPMNNMTPPPGVVISPGVMQRLQNGGGANRINQMGNFQRKNAPIARSPMNGHNGNSWSPQRMQTNRTPNQSHGHTSPMAAGVANSPRNMLVPRNIMQAVPRVNSSPVANKRRRMPSSSGMSAPVPKPQHNPIQNEEVVLSDDDDKVEIIPNKVSAEVHTTKPTKSTTCDDKEEENSIPAEDFDLEPMGEMEEQYIEAQMLEAKGDADCKIDSLGELTDYKIEDSSQTSTCTLSIASVKSETSDVKDTKEGLLDFKVEKVDKLDSGEDSAVDSKKSSLKITSVQSNKCSNNEAFWTQHNSEPNNYSSVSLTDDSLPNIVKSEPSAVVDSGDLALFGAPIVQEMEEKIEEDEEVRPNRPPSVEDLLDNSSPSRVARLKKSLKTSNKQALRMGVKGFMMHSKKSIPSSPDGVTLFPCHICGFVLRNKTSLQTHINAKHTKNKRFKCNICSHELFSQSALSNHLRRLHSLVQSDGLSSTYEAASCEETEQMDAE